MFRRFFQVIGDRPPVHAKLVFNLRLAQPPFGSLQLDYDVRAGHPAVPYVRLNRFVVFGDAVHDSLQTLFHVFVLGRALPRGVEQPQMVEYVVPQLAFVHVRLDQSSQFVDYVETPPNYLVVVSGFYLVDARQAFEKRRHVFGVDVSQRLQRVLYLAGLESHYPVGVQAVFVPLVHARLVNDREYPFGGRPELGRVQIVVPLFYVGILADSRVNRLVFLQPVDLGSYAAQLAVHELGQRLIARVVLYKPLAARRGDVVFIILIQEVGVDFPE